MPEMPAEQDLQQDTAPAADLVADASGPASVDDQNSAANTTHTEGESASAAAACKADEPAATPEQLQVTNSGAPCGSANEQLPMQCTKRRHLPESFKQNSNLPLPDPSGQARDEDQRNSGAEAPESEANSAIVAQPEDAQPPHHGGPPAPKPEDAGPLPPLPPPDRAPSPPPDDQQTQQHSVKVEMPRTTKMEPKPNLCESAIVKAEFPAEPSQSVKRSPAKRLIKEDFHSKKVEKKTPPRTSSQTHEGLPLIWVALGS